MSSDPLINKFRCLKCGHVNFTKIDNPLGIHKTLCNHCNNTFSKFTEESKSRIKYYKNIKDFYSQKSTNKTCKNCYNMVSKDHDELCVSCLKDINLFKKDK